MGLCTVLVFGFAKSTVNPAPTRKPAPAATMRRVRSKDIKKKKMATASNTPTATAMPQGFLAVVVVTGVVPCNSRFCTNNWLFFIKSAEDTSGFCKNSSYFSLNLAFSLATASPRCCSNATSFCSCFRWVSASKRCRSIFLTISNSASDAV
ncbi:hypothetical protein SDC9_171868 [bioreactor metagenome]|uniref:Uncharacterized protein n=1 Tax=bioreactor metagenome TaxID=1076179 RepID=A0A645GFB2_9ZZZZ